MKTRMTALELILHLAEGSTTPNTLQHITKIARGTLAALKEQEEMQPFKDMTDTSYQRGVRDGRKSAQRKPLTSEQIEACIHHVDEDGIGLFAFARAIEAAHGITKGNT